ncbi:MAG: radical SAM family heme chaperone HemW [Lentilitoribacter sp.]
MSAAIYNFPINAEPGFGIYLHWPFCAAKCPYCDFNSHVRHQKIDQPRFVEAFKREIEHNRQSTGPREVTSIFIGGGTPSLMDPETVSEILQAVKSAWTVPDHIEITMEANPSSVEASRFKGYRQAGVNRVSMGVQALNDKDLKFLGRLHNVEEAKKAISLARDIFPRMSFDLIYARPHQTPADWADELRKAIDLAADHLSLYQLTIEEGTPFFKLHEAGKIPMLEDSLQAELYEITQKVCTENGMPSYEVSNHAQPGAESQHNLNYWRYGDYVGVGPGAHGRISTGGKKFATVTEKHPETWLELVEQHEHGIIDIEQLTSQDQADEMLLMGLRLREGIDVSRWSSLSDREFDTERESNLIHYGMIERINNNRIRCTPSGMMVLDSVVADLA